MLEGRIAGGPPSLKTPPRRTVRPANARPQILFLGGDFQRKGGPLLRDTFCRHFADRCDLHILTRSEVPPGPGIFVHRGVEAGSAAWLERWQGADVFVFPSRLETFGIVLLEALAFEVPIVASDAGAARSILGGGTYGCLLPELSEEAIRAALDGVLSSPGAARAKVLEGHQRFGRDFDLPKNTETLAGWLVPGR